MWAAAGSILVVAAAVLGVLLLAAGAWLEARAAPTPDDQYPTVPAAGTVDECPTREST